MSGVARSTTTAPHYTGGSTAATSQTPATFDAGAGIKARGADGAKPAAPSPAQKRQAAAHARRYTGAILNSVKSSNVFAEGPIPLIDKKGKTGWEMSSDGAGGVLIQSSKENDGPGKGAVLQITAQGKALMDNVPIPEGGEFLPGLLKPAVHGLDVAGKLALPPAQARSYVKRVG